MPGENSDVAGKVGLDTTDWKTGISQINRDVRTIESGFKAVAAGMDDWRTSADGLSQRNAALSEIIDKQKQKVSVLEAEYDRMKHAAEENGDTTTRTANALQEFEIKINKAREQLAKSETEYRKNSASLVELERQEAQTANATDGFSNAFENAKDKTVDFGEKVKDVGAHLGQAFVTAAKAAAAAVAAVGAAVAAAAKQAFDFAQSAGAMADNFLTLSAQTGISATELQKWQYASNFLDVSVETMTGSMAKLIKQMDDGNDAFETLGISIRDGASGAMRDSEAVFADCIDALGKISNETERDALAMELFGKKAQDLNPLIIAGGDALRQVGEEAEAMGAVFSEDALSAMGSFDDSMQRFNATAEGMKNAIGLTVIPAFQPLVDAATTSMAEVSNSLRDGLQPGEFETIARKIIESLRDAISGIGDVITDALPLITSGLNMLISTVSEYIPSLINLLLPAAVKLIQSLIDGIVANIEPITECAITLVAELAAALIDALPTLLTAAGKMIATLGSTIWDAVKSTDWSEIGKNILEGVVNGMSAIFGNVKKKITGFFSEIWDGVRSTLGIHSPSTVAAEDGKNMLYGFQSGADAVKASVGTSFKNTFTGMWSGVQNALNESTTQSYGRTLLQGLSSGLTAMKSSVTNTARTVGSEICNGINLGLNSGENSIITAAKNVAMSAISAAKKALGIHSPSRLMAEQVGLPAVQGIAQGITQNTKILQNSMSKAVLGMANVNVKPVFMPATSPAQNGARPVIVSAVLKLRETEFADLVVTLADKGQGFKSSNLIRHELGVQLA